VVKRFGGEKPWSQCGTELQSVATNADEAAGRRHQPACLFLPARDMKGGGCLKVEACEECCRESLDDGKVAMSIGRKSLRTA